MRPRPELRGRVLAAARNAASGADRGVLAALYHDRLLRLCAAGLAALVIANVLVAGGGKARTPVAAVHRLDGVVIPEETGVTAAEQFDELAPALGDAIARSRG
jgi:hypothetical protein